MRISKLDELLPYTAGLDIHSTLWMGMLAAKCFKAPLDPPAK